MGKSDFVTLFFCVKISIRKRLKFKCVWIKFTRFVELIRAIKKNLFFDQRNLLNQCKINEISV
jgi:hypothetical protein